LCPPMVYGPVAHKVDRLENLNESTARIWKLFLEERKPDGEMPPNGLPLYVDVRVSSLSDSTNVEEAD
jgi:hypothetical protein